MNGASNLQSSIFNLQSSIEKRNRSVAVIGTVLFHALLLLIFFLIIFHTPIPPFPESGSPGIEVNFGYSDEGMGNELTVNQQGIEEPKPVSPAEKTKAIAPVEKEPEKIATSNVEETAVINEQPKKAPKKEQPVIIPEKPKKETKKEPEKPPAVVVPEKQKKETPKPVEEQKPSNELANALSKLKNKNNQPGNDGITGNPGNQGKINGNNNTTNYNGDGGTGNGGKGTGDGGNGAGPGKGNFKLSLKGRSLIKRPELTDDSQEEGSVVVEIKVDKYGNVILANAGARGSTTTSAILYSKARQAAMKAKFNPSPEDLDVQVGSITFTFILK